MSPVFPKTTILTFCQTLSVKPGTSRGNQKPLGTFLMEIWTTKHFEPKLISMEAEEIGRVNGDESVTSKCA